MANRADVKTGSPTIRAPFTVHSVSGYGRTAWQVRDGNGYVVGRLVAKVNADEIARLLNAGAEMGSSRA